MKNQVLRQRLRSAALILAFLFFPITMNYFSPYIILDGARQGIVNGSLIAFGLMFFSSLFIGRLWCAWGCPAGGLGEIAFTINSQPVQGRYLNRIKWFIWALWIGLIIWLVISAGGYRQVNLALDTVGGISVAGDADHPIIAAYAVYYIVVGLFLLLSIFLGRRAGCHALCWMAPFMILGRKLRNLVNLPSLRLRVNANACTDCKLCNLHCPMSLDVNRMVQLGSMENSECILCGNCVDHCAKKVIRYSFSAGKSA